MPLCFDRAECRRYRRVAVDLVYSRLCTPILRNQTRRDRPLIRKKTAAPVDSTRLYVTPNSDEERAVLDVLQLYGLPRIINSDEHGMYIDLTPPAHWAANRNRKFRQAIDHVRGE